MLRDSLKDGSVDLIWLHPPFNSNASYNVLFKGPAGTDSAAQIEAFDDTWHWNDSAEEAFGEVVRGRNAAAASMLRAIRQFSGDNDMMAYLAMMAVRLIELHRVLKPTGSLYLHCDPTASRSTFSQDVVMKNVEEENEIIVAVIDETYGGDEETYGDDSRRYREALEAEFAEEFEESNVGPGYDIPAFVTVIRENILPLLPWAIAVFFSGKPIVDNLEAWKKFADAVRRYFARPVVLNRHGAAVIAVEAVFSEIGGIPKILRLASYWPARTFEFEDFQNQRKPRKIEISPPILNLGLVLHLFEIEADGVRFLVGIEGKRIRIRSLDR